jgi:membrane associated rhomboid family serine protease
MALNSNLFADPGLLNILGIVCYPLLHADVIHLLLNSIVFASIGALLESTITRKLFIRILIVATLVPAVCWLLLSLIMPSAEVVGSSGLVFAMFGACLCLFPNMPLNLIFIEVKLWMVSSALIALSLVIMLAQLFGYQSGTAHSVHFFGAVCGWFLVGGHQRFSFSDIGVLKIFSERKAKSVNRKQRDAVARVDDILAKVSRSGIASLSASERKFLEQQSRKK